ncbi:MAG: NAD(P)/FAD-dependent oxidoreductase, partial [Synergistaceae bacterium]|nr:NAD(P)/FAD-dependent oxidoreductase [Synergistaceae bacterium]
MRVTEFDVIVIGGGPAGMASALSASERGASVLLAERSNALGGTLNQCAHSGFGLTYFREELTGREYAARFVARVNESGINVMTDTCVISLQPDAIAVLSGSQGLMTVRAKSVILASGCRERPIGTLDIAGTRPSGVFTAGAAQRMMNIGGYDIGAHFVILGSGDVGMIVARQLKQLGKEVIAVLEQSDKCGGLERNRINCLERYGIPLRTRRTISAIYGNERVLGVTEMNLDSGVEERIPCDTLITSVGLIPERELCEEASTDGRLPDWLFLCGNSCYVHDTVDDVTVESETAGALAAEYAKTGKISSFPVFVKHMSPSISAMICTACPKACPIAINSNGY